MKSVQIELPKEAVALGNLDGCEVGDDITFTVTGKVASYEDGAITVAATEVVKAGDDDDDDETGDEASEGAAQETSSKGGKGPLDYVLSAKRKQSGMGQ
jgi:hypothetical protein